MKKLIFVLTAILGLSVCVSAQDFKKSVGIDITANGIEPNFYMHSNNFELQAGICYMQYDLISLTNTIKPKIEVAYCTNIGESDFRFSIGVANTLMFCFLDDYFSVGDLFGIYLGVAKPIDNRLELGGKICLPLVYSNVGNDSSLNKFLLPSAELFAYSCLSIALEIKFYIF